MIFGTEDFDASGRFVGVVGLKVEFFWVIFGPIGNVFVDVGFKGSCCLIHEIISTKSC